jgi:hypothetical protein
MRPKPSDLFSVGLTLAALLPILSVQAQTKREASPDLPVRNENPQAISTGTEHHR